MSKLDEFVKNHKFGCAFGWGSESQRNDPAFIARWCNCGQLNAAAELATYRAAVASAESILRGFAMRGQEGDLQAAAEWLEKYGGLK